MDEIEQSAEAAHANKIQKLQQKGALAYETSFLVSEGHLRYMDVKVVRIEIQGKVLAMHIASDITERRQQLEAIQGQNEALKQIAWVQSHRLRAPLARKLSLIAMMKDGDTERDENHGQYLNWLDDSSRELDAVVLEINEQVAQSKVSLA